jgi:hypothetical protein
MSSPYGAKGAPYPPRKTSISLKLPITSMFNKPEIRLILPICTVIFYEGV